MNSIFLVIGMLLCVNIGNVYAQESPDHLTEHTAMFTLEINGLSNIEGEIRIVMFNSQELSRITQTQLTLTMVDCSHVHL